VSGDRQSGALKIEDAASAVVDDARDDQRRGADGGLAARDDRPAIGVALWIGYGGDVYAPELLTVIAGHV
jgi:hypothetical protein